MEGRAVAVLGSHPPHQQSGIRIVGSGYYQRASVSDGIADNASTIT